MNDLLVKAAIKASKLAHCPYSNFQVGAAIVTDEGVFTGCNVENASYGLTICAERNAIFSAVAAGAKEVIAAVIYTPTIESTAPCGACRQVFREFVTGDIPIWCVSTRKENTLKTTLFELLPHSFGPENLT